MAETVTGEAGVPLATQATAAAIAANTGRIPALGAAAKAASTPVTLATDDPALADLNALAATTAVSGAAAPASVAVQGAQYNAAPATRVEGHVGPDQQDLAGNKLVSLGTMIAGENSTFGGYANGRLETIEAGTASVVTANATTTVKSGSGALLRLVVGVAGSADARATVYDNTAGSGTSLGVYDLSTLGTRDIKAKCSLGVTIVTTGTTPATIIAVTE